jgi:uncharacterized protein (DUF433 family)
MNRADVYHSHPGIMGGTPVFKGTRVPVDSFVYHLRKGVSLDEFLADFPSVERWQAEAFLALALNDVLAMAPAEPNASPELV